MKVAKFFELAKANGIEECQLTISKSKTTGFSIFHSELEGFQISDDISIKACGVVNGKLGSSSTQKDGKGCFEFLVEGILKSAKISEKEGEASIFPGSKKYHKKNVFNPELGNTPIEDKIKTALSLEKEILAYDSRISEVTAIQYEEKETVSEIYNSHGLKLKDKGNYFIMYAGAAAKDGDKVKENYEISYGTSLSTYNKDEFIKNLCDGVLAKFGADACNSGKYPTVLKNSVFASLANYFIHSTIAEEVQRGSSFLAGKLGTKIASTKITISEKPLLPNIFFSYFDDEGVAKENKDIVKNGVLKTYLYNTETAKVDGVESTGNGAYAGGRLATSYSNIYIKGGKATFDEMISGVKEGVYITEIQGLGTGMNPRSGDFSCQAQGFMIEDGKVTKPLTLITLSGNLFKMLNEVSGFDNNEKLTLSSIICSDILVKQMSIGGK
ncbi:MAG: TldD/PmbA family protein [Bacilli bacterium]|nr:TldD/PmbA family protein [Bacilli bacterium]